MRQTAPAELDLRRSGLSEAKRKLLARYARGHNEDSEVTPEIRRRLPGDPAPLSLFQEQVWRHAVAGRKVASFYNESTTVHRYGDLDREALEHSFTEIIRRHEAWRTTYDTVDNRPIQVIHPAPGRVTIPFIDLSDVPEESRQVEALRLATEDARQPFDLTQGPLVRAVLISLSNKVHLLFVTMHQSITDGVSVYQILPLELTALYTASLTGCSPAVSDLPIQYADFAYWERKQLQGEALREEITYWRTQLRGELLRWPRERLPLSRSTYEGAIQPFAMPKRVSDGLGELSRREGVTAFMTLLAAFASLLHCYIRQQLIITGTVAPAGRRRVEVQNLLGYFLNPVALCIDFSGNPTVRELLQRCREVTSGALSHDSVPVEHLSEQLRPEANSGRPWPFSTAITLAPPTPELDPGWSQTPMDCDGGWAKWDLYLELSVRSNGVMGRAQYRTDVFTPAVLSRFLEDFNKVLECIMFDCEQHISDLPRLCSIEGDPTAAGVEHL
ncbi:MAG TPA: condensation domain-containing protein [Bryobacteraceae bacterium]|nr:condensation domain-containing protein [Bryobacteraceae bacterium]